jgi:endonuclease/exonuclease/phosphatase family metal-dependent hydrolase
MEDGMPDLTVVTYNIWGYYTPAIFLRMSRGELRGAAPDSRAAVQTSLDAVWAKRRALLIRLLGEADPDVVMLQENVRRPGQPERSHARQIGRALGMEVVEGSFYVKTDPQGRDYEIGVALLTHLPVDEAREASYPYDTPSRIGGSPKILQATLDFEERPLQCWTTHFPSQSEAMRIECARALIEELEAADPAIPVLLGGDFNSEPDEEPTRILSDGAEGREAFTDAWAALRPNDPTPTMPTPEPFRRLDHLFLRPGDYALNLKDARIIGDRPDEEGYYASDHCGVRISMSAD